MGATSYCKYAYKVTPTFAPLTRNTWSRAQIRENSMVFVNFLVQRAWAPPGLRDRRQAASEADQRVTEREPTAKKSLRECQSLVTTARERLPRYRIQRDAEREPQRRNHCEDASVMEPLQGRDSYWGAKARLPLPANESQSGDSRCDSKAKGPL